MFKNPKKLLKKKKVSFKVIELRCKLIYCKIVWELVKNSKIIQHPPKKPIEIVFIGVVLKTYFSLNSGF